MSAGTEGGIGLQEPRRGLNQTEGSERWLAGGSAILAVRDNSDINSPCQSAEVEVPPSGKNGAVRGCGPWRAMRLAGQTVPHLLSNLSVIPATI